MSALPPDQLKRYEANLPAVVQQIYMSQQLAQQAEKINLDQQSPWKEQLQLTRENILDAGVSEQADESRRRRQAIRSSITTPIRWSSTR